MLQFVLSLLVVFSLCTTSMVAMRDVLGDYSTCDAIAIEIVERPETHDCVVTATCKDDKENYQLVIPCSDGLSDDDIRDEQVYCLCSSLNKDLVDDKSFNTAEETTDKHVASISIEQHSPGWSQNLGKVFSGLSWRVYITVSIIAILVYISYCIAYYP